MANQSSLHAQDVIQMPVAGGSEVVAVRMEVDLAAVAALNDVYQMGELPADHLPVDCIVDSDDLDTGVAAIILQAGILNAGKTAVDTAASGGASWIGDSTVAQAGGIERATGVAITRVASDSVNDRMVGVVVSTGPATGATGKVGLTLFYRAATHGA